MAAGPAVTVMRSQRREGSVRSIAARTAATPSCTRSRSIGSSSGAADATQPVQMAAQRERRAVDDLDRLEHTDAGERLVLGTDRRRAGGHERAVHPRENVPSQTLITNAV